MLDIASQIGNKIYYIALVDIDKNKTLYQKYHLDNPRNKFYEKWLGTTQHKK